MNIFFSFCLIFVCRLKLILAGVESELIDYFNSDTFKTLQNQWQIERKSFENAINLILEQSYGHKGINLYVRKSPNFYKISDGFYFSDNVVSVVLLEMHLQELPNLIAPEVTIALASNFLHVEAGLGKMIINTDYLLHRNQSEVVFSGLEQDPYQKSPFSFQQVQDCGELTIIADDCTLVGYTITTLSGESVNLGHDTFKVKNCKFSIEIYSAGLGSPPVIAPYFSKKQSEALETMLTNPIKAELMPKLQAAAFTYINTSAIFGDKLPELRSRQMKLFEDSSKYMSRIVRNFVKNIIKDNQGVLPLKPMDVSYTKKCLNKSCKTSAGLGDTVLYGLDTAYSAHVGGLFKLQSTRIGEAFRFSTIQVRGKYFFDNESIKREQDFAIELRDVAVNIEMEAKTNSFALVPSKLVFVGWRAMYFSTVDMGASEYERRALQSFTLGILLNEIPKRLLGQLSDTIRNNKNQALQNLDDSDGSLVLEESTTAKYESNMEKEENPSDLSDTENRKSDSFTVSDVEKNSADEIVNSNSQNELHPSENEVK